ncbi:hypothetical protein TNIN_185891, partial [Trichonephila inaurata madagascariensis]
MRVTQEEGAGRLSTSTADDNIKQAEEKCTAVGLVLLPISKERGLAINRNITSIYFALLYTSVSGKIIL